MRAARSGATIQAMVEFSDEVEHRIGHVREAVVAGVLALAVTGKVDGNAAMIFSEVACDGRPI
jgi:hypothetical protein